MTDTDSPSAQRRILLVDDVELNRVLTEAVLTGATYEVDCVGDGAAALTALDAKSYDLVLMDLDMPGLDGFQATEAIRRRTERDSGVKVVALSSRKGAAEQAKCGEVGMDAHLARPIAPRDLLRAVETFFAPPPETAALFREDLQAEITTRLGVARTRLFLESLLKQCQAIQHAMADPKVSPDTVDRTAHDLASTSGMLGYEALSHRCRDLLIAPNQLWRTRALIPLAAVLERTVCLLQAQVTGAESTAA